MRYVHHSAQERRGEETNTALVPTQHNRRLTRTDPADGQAPARSLPKNMCAFVARAQRHFRMPRWRLPPAAPGFGGRESPGFPIDLTRYQVFYCHRLQHLPWCLRCRQVVNLLRQRGVDARPLRIVCCKLMDGALGRLSTDHSFGVTLCFVLQ